MTELRPHNVKGWYRLGLAHYHLRDYEKASIALKKANTLAGGQGTIRFFHSSILLMLLTGVFLFLWYQMDLPALSVCKTPVTVVFKINLLVFRMLITFLFFSDMAVRKLLLLVEQELKKENKKFSDMFKNSLLVKPT